MKVFVGAVRRASDYIGELLVGEGVKYFKLTGSTPVRERQKLVDKFNSVTEPSEEQVFLMATRVGVRVRLCVQDASHSTR